MSVEPRSWSPEILISGSDFRSAECDDWKLEAPGVREVLERVCVAFSPRPSSPAGQSLCMKLIGLEGIITLA